MRGVPGPRVPLSQAARCPVPLQKAAKGRGVHGDPATLLAWHRRLVTPQVGLHQPPALRATVHGRGDPQLVIHVATDTLAAACVAIFTVGRVAYLVADGADGAD